MEIKIKYHNKHLIRLEQLAIGNWIDLRAAEEVALFAGEEKMISLGVSMKLPEGYEAHVIPRSSTYKNFGIIQLNHFGVIDNSYCGETDIWKFPALALRDTLIRFNDRICQFRIMKIQPKIEFAEVEKMSDISRGGFGSTGVN